MKSVVPKKAAALLLVCAAGLAFFIFETVQTVRANAEAQLMEEWGLETALTSSDAEAEPRKVICLTFDDGPSYLTPKVLEILKQYGVRATFFVTGIDPQYAYCIKEARDAGHTVGMHTYSHDYAEVYASAEAYYADLEKISMLCVELHSAVHTLSRRKLQFHVCKIQSRPDDISDAGCDGAGIPVL